jgi:hypothetical protein
MHQRVRWENVLRAAGASLLLAVVVAWPRLAPPEPSLPGPEPAPLAADEPSPPVPMATPAPRRGGRARAHEPGARARGPGLRRKRPAPERETGARGGERGAGPGDERRRGGDGGTTGSGGGPAGGGATIVPDPAQTEFGFEAG